MLLLTIAALQAVAELGAARPFDEQLRFVFARDDRASPKIAGALTGPPDWSGPAFFRIVRQCGGKKLGVSRNGPHRIVVTGGSGPNNLDIARCVQASTSAGFWVGVRERPATVILFDQQPFRELWRR